MVSISFKKTAHIKRPFDLSTRVFAASYTFIVVNMTSFSDCSKKTCKSFKTVLESILIPGSVESSSFSGSLNNTVDELCSVPVLHGINHLVPAPPFVFLPSTLT